MQTLFVASAGGHLEELWLLQPRLRNISPSRTWVTWESSQSRSLLADENRIFIKKSGPHDIMTALHNARQAREILDSADWSSVVSTGSLPAVPFLSLARARGIPCHFIESAARVIGPSLAARMLERVPGVHRYSQHAGWSDRGTWRYGGSVFDAFASTGTVPCEIRRVVVTLGTIAFDFRRLIEKLRAILPKGADVLWQTGHTDATDLGINSQSFLSSDALSSAMRQADLVVAHAGVGSALAAVQAGHAPLLIPRRKHYGEHIDDHQVQIARELVHRGIAVACDADLLNPDILTIASSLRVEAARAPNFLLDESVRELDFAPALTTLPPSTRRAIA
jgi:UDP-N-acetylglucosamine--N-acetylmuramyl-(pentapeptide) pyrophosphoryl-undecaprenol N-acetylglucosamine transferase